jgi:N-acetylglucosamine kinase
MIYSIKYFWSFHPEIHVMIYILGVDGGGTKTEAIITDQQGKILGRGLSGSSNYHSVGLERAIASLKEASEKALSNAGIKIESFEAACFGLAGVGRKKDRDLLLPAIEKLDMAKRIILTHDAAIALAGATKCQPGVVVIAGTGSMAFGMNRLGETRRAGGWGNILADEGSAYYIGRRALSAACRAYDGRGAETELVNELMKYFRLNDFTDIVREIYGKGASTQRIAALANTVSCLAHTGDEVSEAILIDAGEELALTAEAVIKGLNMQAEEFPVATSGSVFNAGELLLSAFRSGVKNIAPNARIIASRFTPAMGAVFLTL